MQVDFALPGSSLTKLLTSKVQCIIIVASLQDVCIFPAKVGITNCCQRVHLGYSSDVSCGFAN